jgi:hypothetical protein
MTKARLTVLILLLLISGISSFWGFFAERSAHGRIGDFKLAYYGARSIVEHRDPYSEDELQRIFEAEGGQSPSDPNKRREILRKLAMQVYLPTAFLFLAPFGFLSWGAAHLLWMLMTAASLTFAAFLIWDLGANYSADLSFYLICFMLANSGVLFAGGNPAGLVIGLCVVAVWCFLEERHAAAGVACLAVSLAIKPHDVGLVWLFLLLAGGVYRKRALQTFAVVAFLSVPAVMLVLHVSPNWAQELRWNLATTSEPGGNADPGPSNVGGVSPGMIIDLQTVVSAFRDDPHFYNGITYLICGPLLLFWIFTTIRFRPSRQSALIALAAIATLSLLPLYHRPHDAKILLLTIPACAMLWSEGSRVRWCAVMFTFAGIFVTSDIPLALIATLSRNNEASGAVVQSNISMVLLNRPVPLVLLASGIFYLWVYAKRLSPPGIESNSSDRADKA